MYTTCVNIPRSCYKEVFQEIYNIDDEHFVKTIKYLKETITPILDSVLKDEVIEIYKGAPIYDPQEIIIGA